MTRKLFSNTYQPLKTFFWNFNLKLNNCHAPIDHLCIERNPSQVKEKWQAVHSYIFAKISNIILSFFAIFAYVCMYIFCSVKV